MFQIIIASGPVIVENSKVLLNKDEKDNFWKFCGGRIEENDINLKDTAKREIKEEMGVGIEISGNNPYFFYIEKEKEGKTVSIVLVHFIAKRIGEIIPGKDIKEWRWIDLNDLDRENLAPNIIPTLKYFNFL